MPTRSARPVVDSGDVLDTDLFEGLEPPLTDAITVMGVQTPTSIQQALFEPVSAGSDVLAIAPTGSGKTLAYVLPLLQRWVLSDVNCKPGILVLLPTRELARQTYDVIGQLTSRLPWMKVVMLHGGVSINPQLMALRGGADIVIATPGRLMDVHRNNGFDVSVMQHLVLDEADRLLDEGFFDDIDTLMQLMINAQTILVSATFSTRLRKLAARRLKTPVIIDQGANVERLIHRAIEVDKHIRAGVLAHILGVHETSQALVFVARQIRADRLAGALSKAGVAAFALHGKLSQSRRAHVMNGFTSGEIQVVVATDLAARGLDVPRLPAVINFDLPRSPQDYLHRAGRSGRAGQSGQVISLVDADSRAHMNIIEKRCDLKVTRERIEGFLPMESPGPRQLVGDANGGIKGRRLSKKDRLRAAQAGDKGADEGTDYRPPE